METPQRKTYFFGISTLLSSWIMCMGALGLVLFVSLFVDKLWLPAIVLALEFILLANLAKERTSGLGTCNILLYTITRILLATALVMVVINLYYMKFIDPNEFLNGTANRRIPYITILVMSPIMTIVTLWIYSVRHNLGVCKDCELLHGASHQRGFLGKVFRNESSYQLRVLIYISAAITVYTWWYYCHHYSNVNLNQADKVFYLWIPLLIFVASIFFFGLRYLRLFAFYQENVIGDSSEESGITLMRFLIICGDSIFLSVPGESSTSFGRVDTPVISKVDYRSNISLKEAESSFRRRSHIDSPNVDFRFLYENMNLEAHSNIMHYLCSVSSKSFVDESSLQGEWLSIAQVRALRDSNLLSVMLVGELRRIYTVSMAYKTYDRKGYRLYSMKHYVPSFRLRDLPAMEVDFNDPTWIVVSKNNEDRPFFKVRRFIKKYLKGYEM